MTYSQTTWTEQIYRYAEHLYWTPQELKKSNESTYPEIFSKLRKREVPLNLIFNIFMDVISTKIKNRMINSFFDLTISQTKIEDKIEFVDSLELYEKLYHEFIQPDMVFESESSRFLIELKIQSSKLSLQQVYKYLFLHGLWQYKTGIKKTPYILLLTENSIDKQWEAEERKLIFNRGKNLEDLYTYIRSNDLPNQVGKGGLLADVHNEVRQVMEEFRIGWSNWQSVGEILNQELGSLNKTSLSDGEEVIKKLLDGFLIELSRRQLWKFNG